MSETIRIYRYDRTLYVSIPDTMTAQVMAAIGRDGQKPTQQEISIAVTAFQMGASEGAAAAVQQIRDSRGARLERELMGEGKRE